MMASVLRFGLLLVLFVSNQAECKVTGKREALSVDYDWWKHAVVYQIYPRSFKVRFLVRSTFPSIVLLDRCIKLLLTLIASGC